VIALDPMMRPRMKFSSHPAHPEHCKVCEGEIADAEVRLSWFGARFPTSLPPDLRVVLSRTAELPAIGGGASELVIEGDAITASGEWIRAGLVPQLPRRIARVTAIGASPELAAMALEGYELVTRPAPIATVVECA